MIHIYAKIEKLHQGKMIYYDFIECYKLKNLVQIVSDLV